MKPISSEVGTCKMWYLIRDTTLEYQIHDLRQNPGYDWIVWFKKIKQNNAKKKTMILPYLPRLSRFLNAFHQVTCLQRVTLKTVLLKYVISWTNSAIMSFMSVCMMTLSWLNVITIQCVWKTQHFFLTIIIELCSLPTYASLLCCSNNKSKNGSW